MLRRLLTDRKPHCATEQFFRLWHETDMPTALRDVRSQEQSGKQLLAVSFPVLTHSGRLRSHATFAFLRRPASPSPRVTGRDGAHVLKRVVYWRWPRSYLGPAYNGENFCRTRGT